MLRSRGGRAPRLLCAVLTLMSQATPSSAAFLQIHDAKHWFAFGDSWTADGFNATIGLGAAQQSLRTSAGGKTWLDEITFSSTFPALRSSHYNFALGGASAWPEVRAEGFPNVSFPDQVDWFVGNVSDTTRRDKPEWEGASSIFSVFFGTNDINLQTAWGYPITDVLDPTFEAYDDSIARLYDAGARFFLLLNVPSFDRAPVAELVAGLVASSSPGDAARPPMNESIRAWNARLAQYAAELPGRYPGAEVELYDTATWLDETLDRIEASGALITDSWCEAYQPVSWRLWPDVPEDYADPACPAPLKQYAWIDGSHPSWPLHRLLAFDVVRKLSTPAHGHTFRRWAGHLGPVLEGRSGARHGAARGWWARRGGVHGGRGRGRRGGGRKVPKGRLFG